jgi:hypothetical protein
MYENYRAKRPFLNVAETYLVNGNKCHEYVNTPTLIALSGSQCGRVENRSIMQLLVLLLALLSLLQREFLQEQVLLLRQL